MHIILTHEQADFDALASLLGAYLLDDAAIPVLPNRMNRNVRAFINLYGVDLPFIDRHDLPAGPVDGITLVDTQSMVSIKGVGAKTPVNVIDHHALRATLPPEWTFHHVATGANTTIFVEELRQQDTVFNPIHATLLLMGIYEDTGSLSYSRTTPEDLRAAAYLLEQGASLTIAVDFLNHPLSLAQQALYDSLRSTVETYPIHGHSVVLSTGDAGSMEEELSTIAHTLRNLLDPDALFLLIKTRSGIQMIARSTDDSIDVSEITAHFGGGGHARAAAALIKDHSVEGVKAELVKILPDYVRPAVVVAQIMSRGPQVLPPSISAAEAAERMQRYGYEGYPVVEYGRVIGLLTRRDVDRAINHRMNTTTAASLMMAGEVTVRPDDSIDYLQRLMTDTGWGQIPVIHPDTGEIIGIVTRTDLLKTLASEIRNSGFINLASRLETYLPENRLELLKKVSAAAAEQHVALYIVGGFVRDLILEHPSLDFDLVVEGDAIALARALCKQYGGRVTSHARFGTAKWYLQESEGSRQEPEEEEAEVGLPDTGIGGRNSVAHSQNVALPEFLDFISARTEFYTHPTALPTVERGSIKLDLHRRDFTINCLALRLDGRHFGELHDYWGGLDDLRQGLVRILHSLSFVDDPTRMLRAVRFEQRFGFVIEARTQQLLLEAVSLVNRVSGARLRHELDHVLDEERTVQMLSRLGELGLLTAIHPNLHWDSWLRSHLEALSHAKPDPAWGLEKGQVKGTQAGNGRPMWNGFPLKRVLSYIIWFIRLPGEQAEPAMDRLSMPRWLVKDALQAGALSQMLPSLVGLPASQVVGRLEDVSPIAIYAAFLSTSQPQEQSVLLTYATHWSKVSTTITGQDLRKRGLPPGPAYRRILNALRSAWLDGQVSTPEQEKVLLDQLVKGEG